ncbi:hypothetical protein SteCoe_32649 [Stentor coeruleus]|uniref:Arrestin-like N-terminal domain-containing protein n=1 Tax=Stentor coeruleus TaxID=5963 RepID=A0A1R2AYG7_9CILI|nr:hypothetical protein SteCoe_32649 [Stentor coeruleus]
MEKHTNQNSEQIKYPTSHFDNDYLSGPIKNYIFIVLDCYSYVSGENATGEVCLNIIKNVPLASLKIVVKSVETVIVYDKVIKVAPLVEERSEVFNIEEILQTWDALQPGHYIFPFSFKVPFYAPATLNFSGEDSSGHYLKAEIFYHISAKLLSNHKETSQVHSRIITIKNRDSLSKPTSSMEISSIVPSCCFTSRGTTKLHLHIKNSEHSSINSEVKFNLEPDNSLCQVPVNHVTALVFSDITLSTRKGNFHSAKIISKIERAAWINSHSNRVYEKDFDYAVELKGFSEELNPSSNLTPLISCRYFVEMRVFYDVVFNRRPVVVRIPFHVNPHVFYGKEEVLLPLDWDPLEAPICYFAPEMKNMLYVEERDSVV